MGEKGTPARTISVLHLGFIFVLNVMLFAAAGRWVDRHSGAGGLFTAVSILLGVISSFAIAYLTLSRLAKKPLRNGGSPGRET
ncbi:MAG: AtpZ/AtpI family protein [Ignavibacteriales bacterium]